MQTYTFLFSNIIIKVSRKQLNKVSGVRVCVCVVHGRFQFHTIGDDVNADRSIVCSAEMVNGDQFRQPVRKVRDCSQRDICARSICVMFIDFRDCRRATRVSRARLRSIRSQSLSTQRRPNTTEYYPNNTFVVVYCAHVTAYPSTSTAIRIAHNYVYTLFTIPHFIHIIYDAMPISFHHFSKQAALLTLFSFLSLIFTL